MSAREEIETNRLLANLLDIEFDKLVDRSPEELMQLRILVELKIMTKHLEILTEVEFDEVDISK